MHSGRWVWNLIRRCLKDEQHPTIAAATLPIETIGYRRRINEHEYLLIIVVVVLLLGGGGFISDIDPAGPDVVS
jgi:hypothetical protein